MKSLLSLSKRLMFLSTGLFALVLLVSCSSDEPRKPQVDEATTPPSISGEAAASQMMLTLSEKQADELNIQTRMISSDRFRFMLSAPGVVHPAPGHISVVSAPVDGRITHIYAHEGEPIQAGKPLFELESLEFANLAADFLEARAEATYLTEQVDRLSKLVAQNISPQRTLDRAESDLARAEARVRASVSRLQAVGIQKEQMQNWERTSESEEKPILRVDAPISGIINQHLIELGQAVNAYDRILDILNTDIVMVKGFVSPEDAAMLTPGDSLTVTTPEIQEQSDQQVYGVIRSINPALDEQNKSVTVNATVATRNGWPVIGQNVRAEYRASTPNPVIAVPMNAVTYEGEQATVFVQHSPTNYEKRYITIQRMTPEAAIVSSGLQPGDKVAVSQVFSLKALGRFEEYAD